MDTEHNPIDLLTMTGMFQAIGRYPVAPLARIPEVSELGIKRILDAGAWGFVAPNVKTREEAQIVADYGQYPPKGKRSLGSGRFALSFNTDPKTYFERANEEILRVVQIEDIAAVKRIDEILSVPGIDACFIGPNDLCNSMGLAPSLDPPAQGVRGGDPGHPAIGREARRGAGRPHAGSRGGQPPARGRVADGRLHQRPLSPDGGRQGRPRGDQEAVDGLGVILPV